MGKSQRLPCRTSSNLPPFGAISQDDFRQLLRYLIDIDHVQQTEQGRLIIGLTGEKVVRLSNFTPCLQITKSIQSGMTDGIIMPPPPGNRFTLAGRTWEVLDIEPKAKTVWVRGVEG